MDKASGRLTPIYFSAKFGVHVGTVGSQDRGHAKALAECNISKFLYAEKHIGISLLS